MSKFEVIHGDTLHVPADILLLKHAGNFHGADRAVAKTLVSTGKFSLADMKPKPDESVMLDTKGTITPSRVLFVHTAGLFEFGYEEMRQFARRAIEIIVASNLSIKSLTTTVHGVNYGLDAAESLQQLVAGFLDGERGSSKKVVQTVAFVDNNVRRARLLSTALSSLRLDKGNIRHFESWRATKARGDETVGNVLTPRDPETLFTVQPATGGSPRRQEKEHVFVAIPFSEEFQDIYEFGIFAPVRECGYICEKVDEASFTGDVLQRITRRIQSAKFMIAELSDARPNVYLEVGYAWGMRIPVIFVARQGETLHFDVSRHRCIFYRTIGQLARELEKLIRGLRDGDPSDFD